MSTINKHYKSTTSNKLFVNPVLSSHKGLIEITETEFNELLAIKNMPAQITVQQQIDDLENSVTKRNYREFVIGNQYSIDKINKVEAEIAILRAKL